MTGQPRVDREALVEVIFAAMAQVESEAKAKNRTFALLHDMDGPVADAVLAFLATQPPRTVSTLERDAARRALAAYWPAAGGQADYAAALRTQAAAVGAILDVLRITGVQRCPAREPEAEPAAKYCRAHPGCTMSPGHRGACCICGPGSTVCKRGCPSRDVDRG